MATNKPQLAPQTKSQPVVTPASQNPEQANVQNPKGSNQPKPDEKSSRSPVGWAGGFDRRFIAEL